MRKLVALFVCCFCPILFAAQKHGAGMDFEYKISEIPLSIQQKMKNVTWRTSCPVALKDLAYLKLAYYGYDHRKHMGEMIVHKKVATEVVDIFKELYQHHFPIERMELIEVYNGDDDRSVAANNTSAFNCRAKTNQPNIFSTHSYGAAIDINPLINPYVKDGKVYHPESVPYIQREKVERGMIVKNDVVEQAFSQRGWEWGGDWQSLKDYQHFEKNVS